MAKKIFKIEGMDCDACAKMIELDLEDIGITASCNYEKNTLTVEEKEDVVKVKALLKKSGYSLIQP